MLLRSGDSGNAVALIQFAFNGVTAFFPKLAVDGRFGSRTQERVRQHQSQQRLVADGIAGPLTLDTLFEIVTLQGRAKFRNKGLERRSFAPLTPFGFDSATWLNPALAEMMRQQQAFLTWFGQPVPKPQLPAPRLVVVPFPGPVGPVFLPMAEQVTLVPAPPAPASPVQLLQEPEGGAFTIAQKGEISGDIARWKFKEAVWGFSLEWAMLKGRLAELSVGPSVVVNTQGEISGEVELTLGGGSGATLKTKLGQLGILKFLPYLATSVTSEMSFQAFSGFKAAAEFIIDEKHGTKLVIGGKAGTKAIFGPVKQPDGREVHQWTGTPLGATGFINFEGTF